MRNLSGSNLLQVKNHNRQAILLALLHAPASRVELAQKLNLSAMTVSNLTNELLAQGWIGEVPALPEHGRSPGRGRPRIQLQIKAQSRFAIGVHMGIGSYRVALVNLVGELQTCVDGAFNPNEPAELVLADISASIGTLLLVADIGVEEVIGVGFGASGLVDAEQGINVLAPSLNWQDVPVAKLLQTHTQLPVVVENNVRAMALGEAYFGRGRDVGSLAFIYGRVGIAAGLIMNGQVVRGIRAGAGEIGHTTVTAAQGLQCRCGQYGCLETLVTQPLMVSNLLQKPKLAVAIAGALDPIDQFERILQLAQQSQGEVLEQIEEVSVYLGIALRNLVNTLNPERIVLGGMYAQGAEFFLPLLQNHVAQTAFGSLGEHVQIEATAFGLDAGVIGAASIALVKLFYESSELASQLVS